MWKPPGTLLSAVRSGMWPGLHFTAPFCLRGPTTRSWAPNVQPKANSHVLFASVWRVVSYLLLLVSSPNVAERTVVPLVGQRRVEADAEEAREGIAGKVRRLSGGGGQAVQE